MPAEGLKSGAGLECRAKIVATLGPATDAPEILAALLEAGMDVARINFSHGTPREHAARLRLLRRLARERGKTVAVLQDLQGPKIRTGALAGGRPLELAPNSLITLTPRRVAGNNQLLPTNYPQLSSEVRPGNRVLLADGL